MKIGDKVKQVTDALGVEQCDACKERQKKLNDLGAWLSGLFKGEKEQDDARVKS